MEFIIKVLKGQSVSFYRSLAAKTGEPGGNPDYWGSDWTGPRPNDAEWQDAAGVLFGAALQAGVFTRDGAIGPRGIQGEPGIGLTPGSQFTAKVV